MGRVRAPAASFPKADAVHEDQTYQGHETPDNYPNYYTRG